MKARYSTTVAAVLSLLAAAPSLWAQDAQGEQAAVPTGAEATVVGATFTSPGQVQPTEVQVEFIGSGEDLGGTILVPGADVRIPLSEILLTDDRLTFTFEDPGGAATIDCSLNRLKDDSFRGQCEANGQTAEMTIDAFE